MEAWRQRRGSQPAECNPREDRKGKETGRECGGKDGEKGAGDDRQSASRGKIAGGKRRGGRAGDSALRAHEALPHTPPRGKPPETPGPLSLGIQVPERREFVRGSQAAQQRRALDKS